MTNKETEVSTGVAGGATLPFFYTTSGFIAHFSVGLSLKLVYKKEHEETSKSTSSSEE